MFKKKKDVDEFAKVFEKGHDMTVGECLKLTEALDHRLTDMGLCSHQIAIIGQMLMNANSGGDDMEIGSMQMAGLVKGEDIKKILEVIKRKMEEED